MVVGAADLQPEDFQPGAEHVLLWQPKNEYLYRVSNRTKKAITPEEAELIYDGFAANYAKYDRVFMNTEPVGLGLFATNISADEIIYDLIHNIESPRNAPLFEDKFESTDKCSIIYSGVRMILRIKDTGQVVGRGYPYTKFSGRIDSLSAEIHLNNGWLILWEHHDAQSTVLIGYEFLPNPIPTSALDAWKATNLVWEIGEGEDDPYV
jgi:hypothetical protein